MPNTKKMRLMNVMDYLVKRIMYRFKLRTKSKHIAAFLTRNSSTKLWNLIRVSMAKRLGKTRGFGYPYVLTVEPTNRCNLKCPLCPTGKGLVGRSKQNLSLDTYRRLIDEVGKYVYVINFQNWGEPTLAKELPDMIRHAFEHNIFTCVATNGHYKHRINDAFLDSHLDHITVAVDGADNDTYVNYRAGGRLPTVLDNIRDLLRKRDQRKLGHPFVELQFLVFENNLHQVTAIHKLARALNVDGLLIRAAEGPDNASVLSRYYTWDNDRDFCSRFWYTATIASDGGVVPCCNYFYKRDDFGNISSAPFSVVWHNSTFQRNRRIVAKKNFENLPEVCKTCKVYSKEQANFPIWNSDA